MSVITPNMNLLQPTIGVDSGLSWEQAINANTQIIDQHNHTPGYGVQITPSGLNINASLSFQGNAITSLQASVYSPQLSLATLLSTYVIANDLYFNDGAGNIVQLTSGGAVNATSSGISSGTASASFSAGVLVVNAAPTTPANIKAGSILLGNNTAGSKYLTFSPPAAMASNIAVTLPQPPASTSILAMDSSGTITAPYSISGGLNASVLTPASITETQMGPLSVGTPELIAASVTSAKLATNLNLPGTNVEAGSKQVIVGNAATSTGMAIIRGTVSSSGSILNGEGFTAGAPAPGPIFTITFTTAFASTPIITAVTNSSIFTPVVVVIGNASTTSFQVNTFNSSSTGFDFIAIGPR